MKKITVHCNSKTDSECFGTVEVYLPYIGEYSAYPNWIRYKNPEFDTVSSITIIPNSSQKKEWIKANSDSLTSEEKDLIMRIGSFDLDYEHIDDKEVCGACGTDQEHEEED